MHYVRTDPLILIYKPICCCFIFFVSQANIFAFFDILITVDFFYMVMLGFKNYKLITKQFGDLTAMLALPHNFNTIFDIISIIC